jgi:uncharacterized protein (DUF1697 family)
MSIAVALLSAVNLGGRKVEMAPLRAACVAAGIADVKLTAATLHRHLGQVGTARNLNTVAKLAAKARAMEAP